MSPAVRELYRLAKAATFGDRRVLPKHMLKPLHEAARAAGKEMVEAGTAGDRFAQHLLVEAASAAVLYPYLRPAFDALLAAVELLDLLGDTPHEEPDAGPWEKRAGLLG